MDLKTSRTGRRRLFRRGCPAEFSAEIKTPAGRAGSLGVQEHEPRGKAAAEIARLHDWILERAAGLKGD